MQGMQACLGDDFDPWKSKQGRDQDTGTFVQNKNGVRQNFITVKYNLHAYDISYTNFTVSHVLEAEICPVDGIRCR
jgi:hypothetical protein